MTDWRKDPAAEKQRQEEARQEGAVGMTLRVKLDAGAFAPEKAYDLDAGYDLKSMDDVTVWAEDCAVFHTGVHVEIPAGYCGQIWSKSWLHVNRGITTTGLIDAGFSGGIVVKLQNHSCVPYRVNRGDKIAQLVIVPCANAQIEIVDEIQGGERGDGGFGSTGR